jgi:hypothetical protein
MGLALGGSLVWGFLYQPTPLVVEHQEHGNQFSQFPDKRPDGSANAPFFVQVVPGFKSAEERVQEAKEREEKSDADRWLVRWTAALFAATVGLILATGVLGYFGHQQSKDMKDSLATAAEANHINREILISSTRAWLSVEDIKLIYPTGFSETGYQLRLSATIKNLGQSPATGVWVNFESFIAEAGEPFTVARERLLAAARSHPDFIGSTLFPRDDLVVTELTSIGAENFHLSINTRPDGQRKGNLTIFVTVSYQVRGDTKRHVTHHSHSFLNIPIGLELTDGQSIALPTSPFTAGTVD